MKESNHRKVTFQTTVNVILIPSRVDMEPEECKQIWWANTELNQILQRVKFEIRTHAHVENLSLKEAAKTLYGLKW